MKIKIIMAYDLTAVRIATIKKTGEKQNKMKQMSVRMWGNWNSYPFLVRMYNGEKNYSFLKKFKIVSYDPIILLLGKYIQKNRNQDFEQISPHLL